jgi:universal stress protein E
MIPPSDEDTVMDTPRHILVVIDPAATQHPAFARARALAQAFGARVELFACRTPHNTWPNDVKAELGRMAQHLCADGIEADVEVASDNTLHTGIVRKVLRSMPSMVLKDAQPHTLLRRSWQANTDWQLVRLCPAPILFVRPGPWNAHPRIAAAVDIAHPGEKPAQLDHALLGAAETFALATDGELHAVHAHAPVSELASRATIHAVPKASTATPIQVISDQESLARYDLAVLLRSHPVARERRHVLTGSPSESLLRFVGKNGIDLLVMGAYARGWIYNVAVCSTTERIVDVLPCDVLVLKPADFDCPLRPREERQVQASA